MLTHYNGIDQASSSVGTWFLENCSTTLKKTSSREELLMDHSNLDFAESWFYIFLRLSNTVDILRAELKLNFKVPLISLISLQLLAPKFSTILSVISFIFLLVSIDYLAPR